MSISEIVSVSISNDTVTPTQKGFGTPLLVAYHTHNADRVREYASLDEMVADSFGTSEAAYRMAQAAFAQNPRPESVKIGRMSTAVAHTMEITITSATEGEHVKLTIEDEAGNETAIDYTIGAAATTTSVATAVELLVEAVTGLNSTSALAVITAVGATAGKVFWYHSLTNCTIKDITPNASIDDDLTLIENADPDWYGLAISINSETNVDDCAAWISTRDKIFGWQTSDEAELGASGTIGSGLNGLSYDNVFGMFTRNQAEYLVCGWIGAMLPLTPGSATWAHKSVTGASPDSLTTTERGYLEGDKINHYTTVAGVKITRWGWAASGEFIDITVGIHWLKARIAEEVFAALASNKKIPYTDKGVAVIVGIIRAVLLRGAANGIITAESIAVSAPKVADVATADRATRLLPDVKFSATLQGAVHKTTVAGSLTV